MMWDARTAAVPPCSSSHVVTSRRPALLAVMATEQVRVDNPVDLGERQSLLENAFTPEQIAALRANGGLAADDDGGAKTSAGNIADYMSLKVAFGRLTESPTNWHQAAVYALSSTAPEDELLRRRSPVSLAISVVIVLLQLLTIAAVFMAAISPPCNDNNSDCPHDGMFCKASGNGLGAFQSSRCGTCGNYGPMGYEYDESTGKMYNQVSRMSLAAPLSPAARSFVSSCCPPRRFQVIPLLILLWGTLRWIAFTNYSPTRAHR